MRKKLQKKILLLILWRDLPFVTVSIGVATFTKDCSAECDELIEKADFALYEAKSYGRNCVSHI